jgi:hypothetical protein
MRHSNISKPHYAWSVAFICGISVFCGLGLGRFAFGMMLPSISDSLGLSYSQGGVVGFGNLSGYLISVDRVPLDGVAHSGPRADWRAELISRAALQAS